jgi:hypothetical protein
VSRLVRAELLKLRTTRTFLGYAAAGILLTLATVLISILAGDPATVADKRDAVAVGSGLSAIVLLYGIVGSASEYRHRTLAPALLVAPGRARLLAARMLAYGLAGLVLGALMIVIALAIGVPLLAGQPGPDLGGSDYAKVVGGGLLACALAAMLGVGWGALIANQVFAVISAIVWLFVLEPLISPISHDAYTYTISQTATAVAGASGDGQTLVWAAALAVLAVWTAVFVGAAAAVDGRRDV